MAAPAVVGLVHEGPLEARGEPGASSAAEARLLHLAENPLVPLEHNLLGLVVCALQKTAVRGETLQTTRNAPRLEALTRLRAPLRPQSCLP